MPFFNIEPDFNTKNLIVQIQRNSKFKCGIRFLQSKRFLEFSTTICVIEAENQGFAGMSCDSGKSNIQKALIEALRNLSAFEHNPTEYEKEISRNADLWCGTRKFTDSLKELGTSNDFDFEIPKAKTEILKIETKHLPDFAKAPVFVFRAKVINV